MEVPPLAPGITESVDKCTKNIEIQSQKQQYEIANMHNFVPGLPHAEKSQICSNVSMSKSVGRLCFPVNQKHDISLKYLGSSRAIFKFEKKESRKT